jgi:hypothetical protein
MTASPARQSMIKCLIATTRCSVLLRGFRVVLLGVLKGFVFGLTVVITLYKMRVRLGASNNPASTLKSFCTSS